MQLKKESKSVRGALALATCSLLTGTSQGVNAASEEEWEVDSAVLFYSEGSDRVSVVEPVVGLRKALGDDEYVGVRLVVDTLTGSSPNGAIPTDEVQTFTTPSGNSTYTAEPGETPLDPTFRDTRIALSGEWEKPLSERLKGIFSANFSTEHDYQSAGISATLARDFNNRNTTLSAGASFSQDSIEPEGGAPVGLTPMPEFPDVKETQSASEDKTVSELLLGVTQVVNRRTLMQFNYTYGIDDGYLSDPYKLLSVTDDTGNVTGYLYENRPDERSRQTIFWRTLHHLSEDVADVSYRYYWDDWDISSHTLDLRYRHELGGGHYLQPHVRWYKQNAAEFYHFKLDEGAVPTYASADYRLGNMTTNTLGLKYGFASSEKQEYSVRLEYMTQSDDDGQFEDVDAVILQANYSFLF
ncbi:DUF3570 domain-containing protein [Thiohalomonas denitrificans]|uniref:DUF3570 domain-containing protein n=1 Tax=Thiohalomonas denitrificans TaxID=415747 RepID=UPI0026F2D081|nr:DUF3570 domain-containing protein [Thiohalomonas denitrificans]